MHILQLANFYGAQSGGLRVALDELAEQYLDAGAHVTTIIPGDRNRRTVATNGRTFLTVRAPLVPAMGGYRLIVNPGAVQRMIQVVGPDVIELSDKTTLAAAATRIRDQRVPVVLISHERLDAVVGQSFSSRMPVLRAMQVFNNHWGDRADAVVCCSDFAAEEFQDDRETPIERIPLGVDLDTFRPGPMPANTRPRIVTVVRLTVDKDPQLLVETCRELLDRGVDHDWTIYGDGPLRPELEQMACGLPMTFAGYEKDRRTLARKIAEADVGISPGPCETFGLAALELLACGTPVVVPTRGALPELVPQHVGRSCVRSAGLFADAVEEILDEDQTTIRAAARAHAESFSWKASAERFMGLYGELVARQRTHPTFARRRRAA
ncbi:MAG: glycosyltransferase [Actinomycetota bacterium]